MIVNDLLSALDEDKVPLLSLLDRSAAFDTIDHSILLSCFSYSFGISDTVLAWFTSYLTDHTQTISVNGSQSLLAPLHYGVPKGSLLGPILFVLYTQPLSKIIQHHSLYQHSFSEDNQLYISANLSQLQEIIRASKSCISDVKAWMHNNKLQLTPDKTETILTTSKHSKYQCYMATRCTYHRPTYFCCKTGAIQKAYLLTKHIEEFQKTGPAGRKQIRQKE